MGRSLKIQAWIIILVVILTATAGCKKNDINTTSAVTKATIKNTTSLKPSTTTKANNTIGSTTNRISTENTEDNSFETSEETSNYETDETVLNEEPAFDLGGRTIIYNVPLDTGIDPNFNRLSKSFVGNMERLEKKYNFKVEYMVKHMAQARIPFIEASLAGILYAHIITTATPEAYPDFVTKGLIVPLDEYIDFNSPPLDKDFLGQDFILFGKHWGFGSVATGQIYMTYNRSLIESNGLPDPFALQEKYEWTWESFLDIAVLATKDLNGDGILDQYGVTGWPSELFQGLLYSNGARFVRYEGDKPFFALDEPKAYRVMNFISDLMSTYKVYVTPGAKYAQFIAGKAVFLSIDPLLASSLRIGYVLFPMGPDSGGVYKSLLQYRTFTALPTTVPEEDWYKIATIIKEANCLWDPTVPEEFQISIEDTYYTNQSYKLYDTSGSMYDNSEQLYATLAKYSESAVLTDYTPFMPYKNNILVQMNTDLGKKGIPVATFVESYRSQAESIINSVYEQYLLFKK